MRIVTLAITVLLAACVAFPAAAAKKRAPEAVSSDRSTCTGLKLACLGSADRGATGVPRHVQFYRRQSSCRYLGGSTPAPEPYCENLCNSTWEQCMKTGFWEGRFLHRSAERR
jgi:hypothetical protein